MSNLCKICHKTNRINVNFDLSKTHVLNSCWKSTDNYSVEIYQKRSSNNRPNFYVVKTNVRKGSCYHISSQVEYDNCR